jgi:hypothetical protein
VVDRGGSVDGAELDVLPRTDPARHVADRAPQEAGAQVHAQHEGGLRNGLEVDGAVVRTARSVGGLAHEAAPDERLERERHRRLGDARPARDLGARDRGRRPDRLEHRALVQLLE